MKSVLSLLVCLMLSNINSIYAQQDASFSEYQKEFTTYPFSDPDPIANFSKIYPYFRFDGFTEKGVQKKWKVVEIENDFIKILIIYCLYLTYRSVYFSKYPLYKSILNILHKFIYKYYRYLYSIFIL